MCVCGGGGGGAQTLSLAGIIWKRSVSEYTFKI